MGKNRGWLTANGVQIIDCTPPAGVVRGSGDAHMVLDALDTAESEPGEIILLTAESDLTPLLFRLRALNQGIVIYVNDDTAVSYRTFADSFVDEAKLIEVLSRPSETSVVVPKGSIPRPPRIAAAATKPAAPVAKSKATPRRSPPIAAERQALGQSRQPVDRETLAALVRRIHQATNVPLFSPRAFADLFRLLAKEVAEKGYKFQAIAENVAEDMNELGRNVSKRQVGFVIKGLALRGHSFGADDTPEMLAEAFCDQVLYLVENARIDLTEPEKGLVQAWIIGFRPDGAGGPASRGGAEIVPPNPAGAEVGREPPRTLAAGPSKRAQRSRSEPGEQPTAVKTPRKRTRQRAAAKVETGRRRVDAPEPNEPMRAASRPIRVIDESSRSSDEIRSQSADPNARRVGRNGATPAAPRVQPPSPNPDQQREAELEDSILSAIADAVDVLADNGLEEDEAKGTRSARVRDTQLARGAEPPPDVDEAEDEDVDADEIGDEIQRILLSYGENR